MFRWSKEYDRTWKLCEKQTPWCVTNRIIRMSTTLRYRFWYIFSNAWHHAWVLDVFLWAKVWYTSLEPFVVKLQLRMSKWSVCVIPHDFHTIDGFYIPSFVINEKRVLVASLLNTERVLNFMFGPVQIHVQWSWFYQIWPKSTKFDPLEISRINVLIVLEVVSINITDISP